MAIKVSNGLSEPDADRLLDSGPASQVKSFYCGKCDWRGTASAAARHYMRTKHKAEYRPVHREPCDGCGRLVDEEALHLNCGEEWLCDDCFKACGNE